MEVDDTLSCSHSSVFEDLAINKEVYSIENGMQSMTLDNEAEMLEDSHVYNDLGCISTGSIPGVNFSLPFGVMESARAFTQFEKERMDTTLSRICLFCKKHFTGNRSLLLDHLTEQHNFFMGQPDNLVYINEFLDILEYMLNKLQCIYCEGVFKEWSALKEHMRKKMHKRINPNNKVFDKFYMNNYLDALNTLNVSCNDADDEREIEMEPKDECITCLYCDRIYSDFDEVMTHLKAVHDFDLGCMKRQYKLSFYSQIKLINFIRQKVLAKECTICDTPFKSKDDLIRHMIISRHIKLLPPQTKWDQPEYFFSTLDVDYLLCGIQDDDDDSDSSVKIISEDIVMPKSSVLTDESLRNELL